MEYLFFVDNKRVDKSEFFRASPIICVAIEYNNSCCFVDCSEEVDYYVKKIIIERLILYREIPNDIVVAAISPITSTLISDCAVFSLDKVVSLSIRSDRVKQFYFDILKQLRPLEEESKRIKLIWEFLKIERNMAKIISEKVFSEIKVICERYVTHYMRN
jgi:hypothetical protein